MINDERYFEFLYKYDGYHVSSRTYADTDIYELVHNFKAFLMASGFHEDSIKRAFNEDLLDE